MLPALSRLLKTYKNRVLQRLFGIDTINKLLINCIIPLWLHFGTMMANLTIKNIPEDLYQKLKQRAELNRRSMNAEVLVCLEETLIAPQIDVKALLPRIRELRAKSTRHLLTDEEIFRIKNEGRS